MCCVYYNTLPDAGTVRHPLLGGDHPVLQVFQSLLILLGVDGHGCIIQGTVWVLEPLHLLRYRHSPTTTLVAGALVW